MQMEKYLVTGACGFTGSHVCDILAERDIQFLATDLESADRQWLPEGAEFLPADITDPDSIKPLLEGIDIVLHPAAVFDWSASEELLQAVNVHGMENICAAAKEAGVKRVVSWSTSGVYGDQQFDELPITEDYPCKPIDKYSLSKYRQDQIALRYSHEEGLPTTIIRPGVVYGPRSKYGAMQIFDALSMAPIIPIPENFTFKLGTVHARDIAAAAIFVSTKKEADGEIYGVVDDSGVTMRDFFRMIAAVLGKPTIPIFVPPKLAKYGGLIAADISEFIAKNITKTKPLLEKDPIRFFPISLDVSNRKIRELGYEFQYSDVRLGIIETIDFMRDEGMLDISPIERLKELIRG